MPSKSELRQPADHSVPPESVRPDPAGPGNDDPEKNARAFVEQNRKVAQGELKNLKDEAERLRTRLGKVEAGIQPLGSPARGTRCRSAPACDVERTVDLSIEPQDRGRSPPPSSERARRRRSPSRASPEARRHRSSSRVAGSSRSTCPRTPSTAPADGRDEPT